MEPCCTHLIKLSLKGRFRLLQGEGVEESVRLDVRQPSRIAPTSGQALHERTTNLANIKSRVGVGGRVSDVGRGPANVRTMPRKLLLQGQRDSASFSHLYTSRFQGLVAIDIAIIQHARAD